MGRRMRATVTGAAALVLLGAAAVPARADSGLPTITPGASAYAAAAGTGTASLRANLQLSGALGSLLDGLISPIVSQALDPLLSALQGTVNSVANGLLGTASALNAATDPSQLQYGTAPAAFPNDTLPSPCAPSGSQPCYSGLGVNLDVPPLVSAKVGALNGYVEQVAAAADATNPVFGRASSAGISASLLPGIGTLVPGLPSVTNPLVSTGVVNAKANCPNDGAAGATKPKTAPSASVSATGVKLLGGLISLDVLNGQIANLSVNNVSYGSVLSLPTVQVSGVTVSPYGSAILVSIPVSLSQILAGLGLPSSVVSTLTSLGLTSTLALKLVVGPSSIVSTRTVSAWGLGVGADLSGALSFNLLNLVTATVNVPSGIGGGNFGNLLDLRLAYATCQSAAIQGSGGSGSPSVPAIPPGLV